MSIYFSIETNENYTQSMCVGVKHMKTIFKFLIQNFNSKQNQMKAGHRIYSSMYL